MIIGRVMMWQYDTCIDLKELTSVLEESKAHELESDSIGQRKAFGSNVPTSPAARLQRGGEHLAELVEVLGLRENIRPTQSPMRILVVHSGPADLNELNHELKVPVETFDFYVDTSEMAEFLRIAVEPAQQICKLITDNPGLQSTDVR